MTFYIYFVYIYIRCISFMYVTDHVVVLNMYITHISHCVGIVCVTAVNTVLYFNRLLVRGTVTAITKNTIITQIYMSIHIHENT